MKIEVVDIGLIKLFFNKWKDLEMFRHKCSSKEANVRKAVYFRTA